MWVVLLSLFRNTLFNETSKYWFEESANTDGKVGKKLGEIVLGLLNPEENTGCF